jgi:hypothetical protein
MTDEEDYAFSIETSTGLRNVAISKMALGRITAVFHSPRSACGLRLSSTTILTTNSPAASTTSTHLGVDPSHKGERLREAFLAKFKA